ncbi:protease complex subunit PrcB family protein [Salinibacter ruber]|uniref:PrcB C-terminal domain-containing protein n=3 Tax=Salinibacter ruber TaxID=146919 RepID=A0AAW5P4K0_9BACT|nr:protease complex subunit PrcB family protein [Salinibacter ruber]MCS4156756.1 hypothetical protein [Salinibacter ruber]MCS4222089.1 hypothetical protein [Salinibacter ruber]
MQHDGAPRTGRWTLLQAPLVLGMLFLLMGGCNSVGSDPTDETSFNTEVETQTVATGAVDTEELDKGTYGKIVEGTQVVLRSEDELAAFWAELHGGSTSAGGDALPDPPQVDFETQIVVGVVLGERSTGGYSVDIDRVMANEDQGTMRVEYTRIEPGDACVVTQALTSPYVLATVDLQDEPVDSGDEVTFARSEQTRSC